MANYYLPRGISARTVMQEWGGISPAEFRSGSEAAITGFEKIKWQGDLLAVSASPKKPFIQSISSCFLLQTGPF